LAPFLLAAFSFWLYSIIYGEISLTVGRVYASIGYFNIIALPLRHAVVGLSQLPLLKNAFFRLDHFFKTSEVNYDGY
jgi:ABC-type multidrug transport system fused ATPase/permease subunit